MKRRFHRSRCAAVLFFASILATSEASAALISFSGTSADGHAISGNADFTLGAGTLTIKLTNTTATTFDAGELFTGLDFSLGGLTPSLASKTGIERTVADSGSFTDTGSPQDLSWSLISLGSGSYQLNFTPNAEDGIIGPPSGGSYSGANGSIKGNAGHDPFVAETATFVLNVPGATLNTPFDITTFRFGTTLEPATVTTTTTVPEPSTCVLLILGLVIAAWKRVH
jgi:hypothetical protein